MRIAVNTRFLLNDRLEGFGYFIYEHFIRITKAHPEHEFIFIFDRPYDKKFVFNENVKAVITGPPARHPLLWKLWYDVKIPYVLKKYKADVFVSADGFCSLATKVPQCLVVHDLSFLHYPAFIPKSQLMFLRYYTPRYIKQAKAVITVSQFSKNDIIEQYGASPDKIKVILNGAKDSFKPVSVEEKEAIRKKYTDGKEYFIYTGSIHPRKNLVNLLKAFSIFKKRQKSNWKLVIAGRLAWKNEKFNQSLRTYKYRQDVVMTGYLPEEVLANLTAAAYAMVYPSLWEGFGIPVADAMKAGVPVITTKGSAMEEVAAGCALLANTNNHQDLAEKMMMMYKDEGMRANLIKKGNEQVKDYDWGKAANKLWDAIIQLTNYPIS